jgi:S-adenosylmethionine-diacylglycerol 3-amino-3-carboxypropyl transferase
VVIIARLNFTSTNEDGATELAALAGCQRILCLTGTGTRVLDLLAGDAAAIIALDANRVQNFLLALKIAAIARLDRDDCLAFLGIAPAATRVAAYAQLRGDLPDDARAYWDGQTRMVAGGIWHAGQWEALLRWNARFLGLRAGAVRALMAAASPDDQARIWSRHFVSGGLFARVETLGRDLVWRLVMREPAAAFLPDASAVGARIEADFRRAAETFLFQDSDIATLALRGRHTAGGALPLHLQAGTYERVRRNLARLRLHDGTLEGLGGAGLGRFDGFSLSDFGSYCGPDDYARCWAGIIGAAEPGARFCERIFMNPMPPPGRVLFDEALSQRLSARDRSIIYRVRAGTIPAC